MWGGIHCKHAPLQHEVSTWSPETHLRACFSFYRKYARTWQRRSITERNLRFVMLGKIPSSVCGWEGGGGGFPALLKADDPLPHPVFWEITSFFWSQAVEAPQKTWGKYFRFLPASVFWDVPVLFLAPPSHTFILRVMIQKLWKSLKGIYFCLLGKLSAHVAYRFDASKHLRSRLRAQWLLLQIFIDRSSPQLWAEESN